ncbi:MAG: VWA domain-containing protein [Myxococcales bacterium]|nr:VWA domain-containing protein [Myxococcales bacterium]
MLTLLALLGCGLTEADPTDVEVHAPPAAGSLAIATAPDRSERRLAAARKAPLPAGEVILQDCFGRGSARENRSRKRPSGGLFSPSPPASKPQAAPPPAVAAEPADAAAAPAEPAKRKDGPSTVDEQLQTKLEALGYAGGTEEDADAAKGQANDLGRDGKLLEGLLDQTASMPKEEAAKEVVEGDPEAEREPAVDEAQAQGLDWGATVYLSNDDSMSLASAQRVLYSLTQGVGISPSQVRPHELLNYFSFDTAGTPTGQSFSVLGAAEVQRDTLTLSLAVHGANPPRQPLDLTVLLDRSGSMHGEGRMEYTKRGLALMSDQLQEGDRIDVVLFDSRVCTPLQNFVVGRDDPRMLDEVIEALQPTGSTNLDAGLQEAYRVQRSRDAADVHNRNRRVLLITDALLNTGNVNEAVVSEVARAYDDDGIRLTGVGVGRSFNDKMLDMLTEKGKGAYVYLGSDAVVDRIFGPGFDSLTRTIAHDVRFSLDLPNSLAMERFYGEEASTNPEDVQPINYYAGTTQLFLQDLKMRDGQPVRTDPVRMRIEFRDARTGEPEVQELRTTVGALLDGDPHNLRKGLALMSFSDVVMGRAMGGDACGEPLATYQRRAGKLTDDAEIAFVNGLVGKMCGVDMNAVVARGVAVKVRVDADIPIPEVRMSCASGQVERLSGSDRVARFDGVTPGACEVELSGTVPLTAAVEVPETGMDLRCVVRGGRLSCS